MRRQDLSSPGVATVEPVDGSNLQERIANRSGLPELTTNGSTRLQSGLLARSRIDARIARSACPQSDRRRIHAGTRESHRGPPPLALEGRERRASYSSGSGEGEAYLHGHRAPAAAGTVRPASLRRAAPLRDAPSPALVTTAWPYGGRRGRGSGLGALLRWELEGAGLGALSCLRRVRERKREVCG